MDNPESALAISTSVGSAAAAISMVYTDKLNLYVQIGMNLAVGLVGTACFSFVDVKYGKRPSVGAKGKTRCGTTSY